MREFYRMMRSLREALTADFQHGQREYALSAAQVASAYGKSPSWAYQLLHGEVPFTLPMVTSWCSMTDGDHLMRWLANGHHICAPLPSGNPRQDIASALKEFSDYLQVTARAVADGEITREEFADVEREALEACAAIMAEVEALRKDSGRHRKLRAVQ